MNSTNRVLNRLLILLIGLGLLTLGAAAIAVGTSEQVRGVWGDVATRLRRGTTGWLRSLPLAETGSSWFWPAVIAILVVVVILLLAFVFRQGRGRTRVLLTEPATEHGATIVEAAVGEHAVAESIQGRPEFIASQVSTYNVRGVRTLRIAVTCRRGISPKDASQIVEDALLGLDALLGVEIPALIQVSGGFRTRFAKTTRLVSDGLPRRNDQKGSVNGQ